VTTKKIDPARPLYAVVGAGDLAVERVRSYTADVQARMVDVQTRVADLQSRVARLDLEPRDARNAVGAYLNEAAVEVTEAYDDLAARGRDLVGRIRRQQATQGAQAAARTTTAKVRTARTQTTNTAKRNAKATGTSARKTAEATGTSARKTAEATTQATSDAAKKVGD
jgi:heparin binding hemagglutinin HbhA